MGIIPVPDIFGNDCLACFAPGTTPILMKLFFGGIISKTTYPPAPMLAPQGYFDAANTPGLPCVWGGGNPAAIHWKLTWVHPGSLITLAYSTIFSFFRGINVDTCTRFFTNEQQLPNQRWQGGWAFVCTPAEMRAWIEMVTPITGPDPRMELFPMEDDLIVLKFCNIRDGTNVKIKVDTTLL